MDAIAAAVAALAPAEGIMVFTGAGVSTESGIPDFRGPDGLWTKVDPSEFEIERFMAEPELRKKRWRMHADGELWGARSTVEPNEAHHAIVRLHGAGLLTGCVTQNIDGLHLVAGLPESRVAELHGNVRRAGCVRCGATWPTEELLMRVDAGESDPPCPHCGGIVKVSTVMLARCSRSLRWRRRSPSPTRQTPSSSSAPRCRCGQRPGSPSPWPSLGSRWSSSTRVRPTQMSSPMSSSKRTPPQRWVR
ncbi:MAG: hypothetical protein GEU79_06365 [Acidimicrobiia bacterium]|nr:hypothetical protein [Acidimicrobiia bacterium]